MVTDFSGTLIFSNECVVIGRASHDNLGVLLGPWPQCGHRWQKWPKKPKPERNDMELISFCHWTRLNELISLVWSNLVLKVVYLHIYHS